jgi:hypothetical protein
MAVMMRAVGVPARLAAGYAPGDLDETSGQRFIRDSDSHGWVQVYFPEYGWIDFEPTPNWELQSRSIGVEDGSGPFAGDAEGDPDEIDIRDTIDLFSEDMLDDPGGLNSSSFISFDITPYLKPAGITLGTLLVLFLLFQVAWNFGLGGMTIEEKIYTKMGRLGWMAGVGRQPQQTPWEYAAAIGFVAVNATEGARKISDRFAVSRYGRHEPDENELEDLAEAWKNVRMRLIVRGFRRIVPQPSEHPQQAR